MTPPRVMAAGSVSIYLLLNRIAHTRQCKWSQRYVPLCFQNQFPIELPPILRKYVHKFGIKMHCEYILNGCVKNLRNLPCQRKRMIIFSILQIINGLPAHIEQLGEFCLGHIPVIAVILNSVFNHFHTPASLSAACAEKCGTFRSIYKLYHSYRRK